MLKQLVYILFIMPLFSMGNIGFYSRHDSNTIRVGFSEANGAQLITAMENQKKYSNKQSPLSLDGQTIQYHHCNYVEKNPLLDRQYFYVEKSDGIVLLVGHHYQLESIWLLDNDNPTINGKFDRQNPQHFCFFLNQVTWDSKKCLMVSFRDKDDIVPLLFFPPVNGEAVDLYIKDNFYFKSLLDQHLNNQYYESINNDFIKYSQAIKPINPWLDYRKIISTIELPLSSYSIEILCLFFFIVFYLTNTPFNFNELSGFSMLLFFN